MTAWNDVVKLPEKTIRDFVLNRLLFLEVDPHLYGDDPGTVEARFEAMVESSHYPVLTLSVSDDEGERRFLMAVAFMPNGFFATACLEVPEQGEVVEVNVGLHVQGKNFSSSGYHVLRYNSPHLNHSSKKSPGSDKWHFDVVAEGGKEFKVPDSSENLVKISIQDLFREWYDLAVQAQRIVPSRYENWHIDFMEEDREDEKNALGKSIVEAMEKYPPFKQAIQARGFKR